MLWLAYLFPLQCYSLLEFLFPLVPNSPFPSLVESNQPHMCCRDELYDLNFSVSLSFSASSFDKSGKVRHDTLDTGDMVPPALSSPMTSVTPRVAKR